MKKYRFPSYKTVESVLATGQTYRGYYKKPFYIGLSWDGRFVGRVGDRAYSNNNLVTTMAEVFQCLNSY